MQLKLQRSQRLGGALGKTVLFCLDARADYSAAETANISKYKLGGQVVYNSQAARKHLDRAGDHLDRTQSGTNTERFVGMARGAFSLALAKMQLNISIASLGRGHHIECKDLPELLDAEQALMEACRNLKGFLEAAATFNGSVILVDFDDGEKVHMSQGALKLETTPVPGNGQDIPVRPPLGSPLPPDPMRLFSDLYSAYPKTCQVCAAALAGVAVILLSGGGTVPVLIAALVVGGALLYTRIA